MPNNGSPGKKMIRSILIDSQGVKNADLSPEQVRTALGDEKSLIWVSLEHPTQEEASSTLHDIFHFHPLAVEDCMNSGYQTPKVDDFGSYIFIIAHAIHCLDDVSQVRTIELNFFLGKNYLVTIHNDDVMPPVEQLWQLMDKDERLINNGSDFLCHSLLDFLVDDYMPVLDKLDDEIEYLEDMLLEKPQPKNLQRILELKHTLINLRRIMSPLREVMNRLSRDEFAMIDQQSRIYFRDIYDHLVRFQDLVESLRDIVAGAMDIYLNSTSLRLNEVMKALTIVSTIFLPLSFVAGMYGMNFSNMFPVWDWPYGYLLFWVICIGIAVGMILFFKNRGWF
jgi:magnesium transporter